MTMSHPPKNSPSMYSWGNVGQLEYSFNPWRKSSFSKMFIVSKGAFKDLSICTTLFENPHWGKSLVPFMKRRTFSDVTTLSKVVFSSGVNAAHFQSNEQRRKTSLTILTSMCITKQIIKKTEPQKDYKKIIEVG